MEGRRTWHGGFSCHSLVSLASRSILLHEIYNTSRETTKKITGYGRYSETTDFRAEAAVAPANGQPQQHARRDRQGTPPEGVSKAYSGIIELFHNRYESISWKSGRESFNSHTGDVLI